MRFLFAAPQELSSGMRPVTENGGALEFQQRTISGFESFAEIVIPSEWYAIQTLPRHEKSVTKQFEKSGIETLLPLCKQIHRWSDRRKVVHLPLFPCYLFARLSDPNRERLRLLRTTGVVGFVGNGREALPIPFAQIQHVRTLVKSSVDYDPFPYLRVGQRVRVRDGALQGLEGILVRAPEGRSVVLSVDLIQRSVAVRIEGNSLETI